MTPCEHPPAYEHNGQPISAAAFYAIACDPRRSVAVEACAGAATGVDLFFDREGLADDEENEEVAAWISDAPVPGASELVLHAPAGRWAGESVEVVVDRGSIATAVGEGGREVLSQVAFRSGDLAVMEPGTVYTNDSDPDVRVMISANSVAS